jgi:pimeloyl-ACP methyl ester carboxylesterase
MIRKPHLSLALLACALVSLAGCGGSALAPSGAGDQAAPPLSAIATISGHGATTVVLQSGLQDDRTSWSSVQPRLAKHATVISHDRPGRGAYGPALTSRDPCSIAREQHALLQRAGLPPPYVLVGHSLGGLYQYAFARLYPDEVAGMVLIDPTHPAHWATMQREHPGSAALMRAIRLTAFTTADRAEFDQQSECIDTLPPPRTRPTPTILLVSGQRRPEELGMVPMIERLRKDWLQLLGIGGMELVKDAGHYVQHDRPDVVVKAVQSVISAIE